MARVTVEDCLDHVEDRFSLVMMATVQLLEGAALAALPVVVVSLVAAVAMMPVQQGRGH